MFSIDSLAGYEIHLPVSADSLVLILGMLTDQSTLEKIYWQDVEGAINFSRTYEMNTLTHDLFYLACLEDPLNHRIQAFVLACEIDHPLGACRLLRRAGSGEGGGKTGKSLRPNSGEWTPSDLERLSHTWLWALTCAVSWADKILNMERHADRSSVDYWTVVMGEFMACMTRCESYSVEHQPQI